MVPTHVTIQECRSLLQRTSPLKGPAREAVEGMAFGKNLPTRLEYSVKPSGKLPERNLSSWGITRKPYKPTKKREKTQSVFRFPERKHHPRPMRPFATYSGFRQSA
jgi:hypothetical protein